MHISEALRVPSGALVEVFGYLIIDSISEKQFLCENLLESFPPQCGGLSIELRGEGPARAFETSQRRRSILD